MHVVIAPYCMAVVLCPYTFAVDRALGSYARLLGMLATVADADEEDMCNVVTALSELLVGSSSIGSDPVKFDAPEEERMKAVALRLLEFEDKHVEGIPALKGLQAFAPGWNLIKDKYTHPLLEPHQLLARDGELEPWLDVVYFDTMDEGAEYTQRVSSVRASTCSHAFAFRDNDALDLPLS